MRLIKEQMMIFTLVALCVLGHTFSWASPLQDQLEETLKTIKSSGGVVTRIRRSPVWIDIRFEAGNGLGFEIRNQHLQIDRARSEKRCKDYLISPDYYSRCRPPVFRTRL